MSSSLPEVLLGSSPTLTFFYSFLMLFPLPYGQQGCRFPDFLQSPARDLDDRNRKSPTMTSPGRSARESRSKWRWKIGDQNTEHQFDVYVSDDVIVFVPLRQCSEFQYNYTCVSALDGGGVYFVARDQRNVTRSFVCVEFVRRTSGVVQLRSSLPVDEKDGPPSGCRGDDLEPWLLVEEGAAGQDKDGCALSGGFGVRIYDGSRTIQGVCDGYRVETRIESDCLRGDGMLFHFRHQDCIPDGLYMYTTQRTLCLTSWTAGPYTFTLLRHEQHRYMWLLRFPTLTEDSFVAYLFKDLAADVREHVTGSGSHLRLDVVRDSPRPASSLCVDEHDVCSVWRDPCNSGPRQLALTCPRTCGVCNASRPTVCSFPPEVVGRWHDVAGSSVTIGETSILLSAGTRRPEATMRCIRWRGEPSSSASSFRRRRIFTRFLIEEMLVTEYSNGCRPRYSCARILRKSASVVFFKLSKAITWPLTSSPDEPIDCANFDFDHVTTMEEEEEQEGEGEGEGDVFRGRYYRLLVSTDRRNSTSCRLPSDLIDYGFRLRNDDGDDDDCSANVTESVTGNEFDVSFSSGCNDDVTIANITFVCLESSRLLPSGDLLVVTTTTASPTLTLPTSNASVVHCWIFPRNIPHTLVFYQIDGAMCNEASRGRLRHEALLPMAVFTKFRRKEFRGKGEGEGQEDHVTISSQLDSPEIPNNNQVLLEEKEERSEVVEAEEIKARSAAPPDDRRSRSMEGHSDPPSPFLLLSLVAIFAIIQFAYFYHHV